MRRAIVIGASSGIGEALCEILASEGYEVGLASRRVERLEEIADGLPTRSRVRGLDLRQPEQARHALEELIREMGEVDLIVINSGVTTRDGDWEDERRVVDVNVAGFVAMANLGMDYFSGRGRGHLVGISSVSALRAAAVSASYSASKAFVSRYLEGLRLKAVRLGLDVQVTDVKPGFVDTPMTEGQEGLFWVAPVDVAARQIYEAIKNRQRHVYVTRRWRLVAWILKAMPFPVLAWLARRRAEAQRNGG